MTQAVVVVIEVQGVLLCMQTNAQDYADDE